MSTTAARPVTDPAVAAILAWWDDHARALPWRASRDVYAIWVAEVMSVQTSVLRAAQAWERWIARWPSVQALAAASLADVLVQWQGLGYPRRARDLHRSAQIVCDRGWPAELTELPGVGPYVAAAIRCFAREEAVLPLDVNTRRVLARLLPEGVDITGDPWRAGQALMEFGQRICTTHPACAECPAAGDCPARAELGASGGRGRAVTPATDPAPRARRQSPYAGSLRQRRGVLLARVLSDGETGLGEADGEAARTLLADGLLTLSDGRLRPPD